MPARSRISRKRIVSLPAITDCCFVESNRCFVESKRGIAAPGRYTKERPSAADFHHDRKPQERKAKNPVLAYTWRSTDITGKPP
jgi:hypothetical protein